MTGSRVLHLTAASAVFANVLLAGMAAPAIEWERTFGGPRGDSGRSVIQTTDENYLLVGMANYSDADATGGDVYLIKIDKQGNEIWSKIFGGEKEDVGSSVQQTRDGGYIIAGKTNSFGYGKHDAYLLKITENGEKEWHRTFGSTDDDEGFSAVQTKDGGYALVGTRKMTHVTGMHADVFLVKTRPDGRHRWWRTFGGKAADHGLSVQELQGGGYILAGHIGWSRDGGNADIWIGKTDSVGDQQWTRRFGSAGSDRAYSVKLTRDGGYVVAGEMRLPKPRWADMCLIKIGRDGSEAWLKTYGGNGDDRATTVLQTRDGGYLLAGTRTPAEVGYSDVYIVKTDGAGNEAWTKRMGRQGEWNDTCSCIQQTRDGGYIAVGSRWSAKHPSQVYVVKLAAEKRSP